MVLSRTAAYRYHAGALNHVSALQFGGSTHCPVEPADALWSHRNARRCFRAWQLSDWRRHGPIRIRLLAAGWGDRDPSRRHAWAGLGNFQVAASITLPECYNSATASVRGK